jgi:hypothetical protein
MSSHHEDNKRGFIEGYKSIMGKNASNPSIPSTPPIPAGKTAFQVGLLHGIKEGKRRKRTKTED